MNNHEAFLEAGSELKKITKSRVRFLVVGDGGLRQQLEARVRELGLPDDVLFLGSREDPEKFYPGLDIVALTSLNEGTPLSLIEAMANERPVIATAVGGVVDLLGPKLSAADGYDVCERGLSVEGNDAASFARGLKRLIEDDSLRQDLANRGRQFVVKNYSKDRLLSDISNLYQGLTLQKSDREEGRSQLVKPSWP